MTIGERLLEDLTWWKHNLLIGYNPIRKRLFTLEMSSDASRTGWGAYCNNVGTHGFWRNAENNFHINYLELLAAFFALKSFASKSYNYEILLILDNTIAIAYINKDGGVQYQKFSELARQIRQ